MIYYIKIMEEYVKKDFAKILKANALEARRWMNQSDSDVARIYDRNIESLQLTVELYGKYAKIVNYDENLSDENCEEAIDIVSRMVYVEREKIIFQDRKKRENKEQHEKLDERRVVVRVKENGLSFITDLTTHIDTGLFLDHVNTRLFVKENAFGLSVLNLFSYTGSFSVYAAAGGADSVTSVDLSNTYCEIAKQNLKNNGFLSEKAFPVITMDATVFIDKAIEENKKWDLIIFDPPSFSNSHKMEKPFDVKKDANIWFYKLSKVLKQKGILIFSTNLATFSLDKTKLKKAYKITEITDDVRPIGFSSKKSGKSRVFIFEKIQDASTDIFRDNVIRKRKVERVKDEDFERLVLSMEKDDEDRKSSPRVDRKERSNDRQSRREDRPRFNRSEDSRSNRKSFSRDDDRRSYHDEGRKSYHRRDDEKRSYSYDDRRSKGRDDDRRSYNRFDDRPSYPRRDEERGFNRQDRRWDDRPRRDFDDRPSRDRGYDDRRRRDDRSFDSKRNDRDFSKSNPKSERRSVKPYGYDSIKKSRSRDEDTFFWRDDE